MWELQLPRTLMVGASLRLCRADPLPPGVAWQPVRASVPAW
jgi:hypothetical protein